jgi:hypothetical protein
VPVNSQGILRLAKLRFAPQILSSPVRRLILLEQPHYLVSSAVVGVAV